MKHLLRLTDMDVSVMRDIFALADTMWGKGGLLTGKCIVLFFPASSIRTRITFEKGIRLLGGQPVLYPPETLDKKEAVRDVMGYLQNWADGVVIRHPSLALMEEMAAHSSIPVINAMSNENHPCEVLSDLYALSKLRGDYMDLQYTFVGAAGNIGNAWFEASQAFGLRFRQCCPQGKGYAIMGAQMMHGLDEAMTGTDIVLTDPVPSSAQVDFEAYQITSKAIKKANKGALLNPCPPFYRGREVSDEVIDSGFFVGYSFKKDLLTVQQAVLAYLVSGGPAGIPCRSHEQQ